MNLVQFLKEVDETVSGMTKEQLQIYVHEIARTLPEDKRQHFLEILDTVRKDNDCVAMQSDKHYDILSCEVKEVIEILGSINDGDRCLDSEYNEEWDDWYNSDAEEVLFSDPERLLQDIERAIGLLHKCIDMEAYEEGCKLAEALSVLEVSVTGDYNDYDGMPLEIQDLYNHNLLKGTLENVVKEVLYLTYMGNELSFRAEELYCMMENYGCYNVTLEDIMQNGKKELPEFNEFLLLWIEYLGCQNGKGIKKLLQEAQMMLQDDELTLKIARKLVNQHPELYKNLLQKGLEGKAWEKMFQIGLEALDKIPVTYTLRSEIALLTAEFANRLNDYKSAEFCWIEAFRSDTSVVNYMRIRFQTKDWEQYREKVKQIYEDTYERTKSASKGTMGGHYECRQRLNVLCRNAYCTLLFFDEDYKKVIQLGLSEKNALGWSSTFMKEGLAMFLLLFHKGKRLPKGLESMLEIVISACDFQLEQFLKGTCVNVTGNKREVFWELFYQWKSEIDITENDYSTWMEMIEKYILLRTKGIMEGNHRAYYGECAALIAAYGEVRESRGVIGAKADVMEMYRLKYSRRRAFHQELRNFGMCR